MLLEHLKATERHIARGREHIAHQRELIAHLEHDGHATAAARAKDILQSFLEIQALHESDRERILLALDHAQPQVVQPAASDGLTAELRCTSRRMLSASRQVPQSRGKKPLASGGRQLEASCEEVH
jgi:hypothetical protein